MQGFHDHTRALLTGIAGVGFDLMALSGAFGETGNLVMAERLSGLGAQLDHLTNGMEEALKPQWERITPKHMDAGRLLLFIPAYVGGDPVRLGAWDRIAQNWRTTSGLCEPDAQPTLCQHLPTPPLYRSILRDLRGS